MKKIVLFIAVILLVVTSCGEKKKEETKEVETATEEVKKPEVKQEEPTNNDVVIEGDDNMRFNLKRIVVKGGEKVKITLKHVGKMSKELMGHNLVILKKGTNLNEFGQKANAAKDTDYIPEDMKDVIIAHTEMIGGGEETTIEFDAPEAGEYDFLCSFPAHYAIMKGKFVVK
ncbi:MAG: azurin [Flavobacteriaceae bacterium]|nr:azurin [Flavobacteriaceae bacterium]